MSYHDLGCNFFISLNHTLEIKVLNTGQKYALLVKRYI